MKDKSIVLNKTYTHSQYTSEDFTIWLVDDDGDDKYEIERTITTRFILTEDEFAKHSLDMFEKMISDQDPASRIVKEFEDARNN